MGFPLLIQARSVSDGVGTTIDVATPCVASDPPAHAEGLYGGGIPRRSLAADVSIETSA